MPHRCVSVFPVSVSCSRFDLQPAGGEAASAASLALPAVPRSQWNCPKDQTRCRSGEHHLASPKPFIFTFLFMTKQMRYNCQLLRGVMCWNYFLVVHHLCSAPWRLAVTVRLLALVPETKTKPVLIDHIWQPWLFSEMLHKSAGRMDALLFVKKVSSHLIFHVRLKKNLEPRC